MVMRNTTRTIAHCDCLSVWRRNLNLGRLAWLTILLTVLVTATSAWAGDPATGLIHIPLRWCAIEGSPAVTNPGGVGEPDTDNVLWRRHERASENIWIPGATITFRSAITKAIRDAASFPIIDDPVPPAAGGAGQLGDILDPQINGMELNLAIAACNMAWDNLEGTFDTNLLGPIALNLRRFVDNSGSPTNLVGWGGFTGTNSGSNTCATPPTGLTSAIGGYASVVDNSFRLPSDPIEALLAHEMGHVLRLGHGNGLDDDGDDVYDDNVFGCDPDEDVNAGPANMMAPIVGSGVITSLQRGTGRGLALVYSGTQVDPPGVLFNADTISDQRVDTVQEVNDASVDMVWVSMITNTPHSTTTFQHRLLSIIDPEPGETRQYVVFADLDDNAGTGGTPADLGFPTSFQGAELVTRVEVSRFVVGAVPTRGLMASALSLLTKQAFAQPAGTTAPPLSAIGTVWRFEAGSFVEVSDFAIRASAIAPIGGEAPTSLFSLVSIDMPDTVRGPASNRIRLQAIAQRIEPEGDLDRLPDQPTDGGVTIRLTPPVFPLCGVVPELVPAGSFATVEASGLIPDEIAKIVFGDQMVINAPIDADGNVTAEFLVPSDAREGVHLVTVGVQGTALTADCAVDVAPPVAIRYVYAAKLVCGVQADTRNMQLTRGFYGTTINVHNPSDNQVAFVKRLALSVPPGHEKPGKVIPIAEDVLGSYQALAIDCEDISQRLFNGRLPAPFIEGFVVIDSPQSLNVTSVYTTSTLNAEGTAEDHSSIHVEQVRERIIKGAQLNNKKPDLVVLDIDLDSLKVDCPYGAGSCVTSVHVTVANIGADNAGAFTTRVVIDPAQSVVVDKAFPGGLAAGESQTFNITTPAGGNCFDPDCTVCAKVDIADDVSETNEGNNEMCKTKGG